jgi:hypothetical protein
MMDFKSNFSSTMDSAKQKTKIFLRRALWIALVAGLLAFVVYYFWRTYEYSDGSRTGLLFKASYKGMIVKTYEGQLHVGGSMMMSDKSVFDFSIKNNEVYKKIQQFEGKNVRIHYKELNDAFFWQGDTNYIVYDVEPLP